MSKVLCGKVCIGAVNVCYSGVEHSVAALADCLVRSAASQIGLVEEEAALLEELGSCWESREAVYEIASHVGTTQNSMELLDRIIGSAVSITPGCCGVLWIEDGGLLRPIAVKNAPALAAPDTLDGIAGMALAGLSATVLNWGREIEAAQVTSPELSRAHSVSVIPIGTAHGLVGALEVWSVQTGSRLDSRDIKLLQNLAQQAGIGIENHRLCP